MDERQIWDNFVMQEPNAIAWHLFEWSDLVEKHFGTRFFPIAAEDNSGVAGILRLYFTKPLIGKARMISVPHAVAGGILSDSNPAVRALLQKAVELSDDLGAVGITLKQYKIRIEADLSLDDNYYNKELSLEGGPENVWNRISENNREMVLKIESHNLRFEHPAEELGDFYRSLLKHHRRKGIPCVSKAWISDLIDLGMYSTAVVKRDGRIVAGTMVKTFKDTVSLPFTFVLGEDLSDHLPAYQLYWDLIKKYSSDGFRIYHSGRIPASDEVDRYRLGWGGKLYNYYYQYYPRRNQVTEFSRKRSWKRELFSSLWRIMPSRISSILGPTIIKQFP